MLLKFSLSVSTATLHKSKENTCLKSGRTHHISSHKPIQADGMEMKTMTTFTQPSLEDKIKALGTYLIDIILCVILINL